MQVFKCRFGSTTELYITASEAEMRDDIPHNAWCGTQIDDRCPTHQASSTVTTPLPYAVVAEHMVTG